MNLSAQRIPFHPIEPVDGLDRNHWRLTDPDPLLEALELSIADRHAALARQRRPAVSGARHPMNPDTVPRPPQRKVPAVGIADRERTGSIELRQLGIVDPARYAIDAKGRPQIPF